MQSQLYHIISLSNTSCLIVAKSWQRPEFFLTDLAEELKTFSEISEVYFDFLVKNGLKDRFYKAIFQAITPSFISLSSTTVSSDIKSKANDFFAKNVQLLDNSVLTAAQKYILKKELVA